MEGLQVVQNSWYRSVQPQQLTTTDNNHHRHQPPITNQGTNHQQTPRNHSHHHSSPVPTWALVMVYSSLENWGISSAGWFCSLMAAYCGGKVFRLKQKLQTHSLARKSTCRERVQDPVFCPQGHLAHGVEDGLAGLPGAGDGVVLDGRQVRPFLQGRVERGQLG